MSIEKIQYVSVQEIQNSIDKCMMIGDKLKRALKLRNLTYDSLVLLVGISGGRISHYANNRREPVA